MDESKIKTITIAASEVFLRYGYARTTMNDIAQAACMSRPALYLVFAGKDKVFQAVAHHLTDDALLKIRDTIANTHTLEEKLKIACYNWSAGSYDLIKSQPDAGDLFDLSFPVIHETHQKFENFLVELLADAVKASSITLTAQELAHMLVFALRGFMEGAVDGEDICGMIDVQVALVIRALGCQ